MVLVCLVCVLFDGFIIVLANPLNHQQCQVFLMLKQHSGIRVSIILKKVSFSKRKQRPEGRR
jgi:hypothetical protein